MNYPPPLVVTDLIFVGNLLNTQSVFCHFNLIFSIRKSLILAVIDLCQKLVEHIKCILPSQSNFLDTKELGIKSNFSNPQIISFVHLKVCVNLTGKLFKIK